MVQRFANQIDEQLNACGTGTFRDGVCECQHPYTGTHCEIVDCGYGKLVDTLLAYDTITTPKGPAGCACEAQYWGYNCMNCTSKYDCTGPCKQGYYGPRCDILCKEGSENDAQGVLHMQAGGTYNYYTEQGFCLNDGTVQCKEGRAGAHCEFECLDCVYGKCNLEDGSCDCFDGYFGELCEGTCPGRCSGLNGVCQNDGTCKCYDGFTGEDCSLECCVEGRGTSLGSVHGNCAENVAGCACFEEHIPHTLPFELDLNYYGIGWQGSECDCHENVTCGGRGTCGESGCVCASNFQGARCDICADDKIGPFCQYDRWQCPDELNSHGEFVALNSRGDYGCKCDSGFAGSSCEECIDSAYPKSGSSMCTYIIPDSLCHSGTVNPNYSGTGDMCVCDGHFDVETDCASCMDHWYGPDCDVYCHSTCKESGGVCAQSGCLCPKGKTLQGGVCVFCGGDEGCENGSCIEGACRCDPGYYGDNCNVSAPSANGKVCNGYPSIIVEENAFCNATADCLDESEDAATANLMVAYRARINDRQKQMFCHRDDTPKGLKNIAGCCVDREGDGFCDADKLEDENCTYVNSAGNVDNGEFVSDICNKRALENESNVFEWCLSKERGCTMNGACEDPDLCKDRCDAGLEPSDWVKRWEWDHSRTMSSLMSESWRFASDFADPYEYRSSYESASINDVCAAGSMYDVCRDYLIPDATVFNLTHKFTGKWELMPNYKDCTLTKSLTLQVDGKLEVSIDPVWAGVVETLQENTIAFARFNNGDETYSGNDWIDSLSVFGKGRVDVLIYNYTSDTCSEFLRRVGSHYDVCKVITFHELDYDWSAFCNWRPSTGVGGFDDRCYRQSSVCTSGCDNYQEGCEGLPLLSEFPTPMPAPCDKHWEGFCENYMNYSHKEQGVCAYAQCECEGYGVGGPACDLQCPVPSGVATELACGSDLGMGRCLRDRGVIAFGFEQGKCDCFNGGDPNLGCTKVCQGEQDCSSNIDTPFSFEYDNCTNLADVDDSKEAVPNTCHVWLRDSMCNFFRGRCECASPFTVFTIDEKPLYLNPHHSYRIALMQGYEIDEYLPFTTYEGTLPDRDREAFDANDPKFKCFKDIEHTQEVPCDWIRALKHFARGGSYRIGDCHNLAPGTDIEYQVPCSGHGFPQGGTCACDYAEESELRSSGVGLSFEQPGLTQTPWRGKACQFVCPGYDMKSMDSVCSGHGRCESDGRCACNQGWTGYKCDLPCELEQKPLSCSGHGTCEERVVSRDVDFLDCESLPECGTPPCTNETMLLARDRVILRDGVIYHMYKASALMVDVYDSGKTTRVATLDDFFIEGRAVRHSYYFSSDLPFMPCEDSMTVVREKAGHPLLPEFDSVSLPCNLRTRKEERFGGYDILCGVCNCEEKSQTGNWTGYDCRTPALGFYRNDAKSQCPGMTDDMKPCNGGGTCKWGSVDGLGEEISTQATRCYCGDTTLQANLTNAPRYGNGILVHAESFGTPLFYDTVDTFPRQNGTCPEGTEPIKYAKDCKTTFAPLTPYSLIEDYRYCEGGVKTDVNASSLQKLVHDCYLACIDATHFAVGSDECWCMTQKLEECTLVEGMIPYFIHHHSFPYDLSQGGVDPYTEGVCGEVSVQFTVVPPKPTYRFISDRTQCSKSYVDGEWVTGSLPLNKVYSVRLLPTDPNYDSDPVQECTNRCNDVGTGFSILNHAPSGNIDACVCSEDCLTDNEFVSSSEAYVFQLVPEPITLDISLSNCKPSELALSNYNNDCSCKFGWRGPTCEIERMMCLWSGEELENECLCKINDELNPKTSKYGCCTKGTYWNQERYSSFTPLTDFKEMPDSRFYKDAFLYVCKPPDTYISFSDDQERVRSIHNYVINTDEYLLTRPTSCANAVSKVLFTPVFKSVSPPSPDTFTVANTYGDSVVSVTAAKDIKSFEYKRGVDPADQCASFCVEQDKGYVGFTLLTTEPNVNVKESRVCKKDDMVQTYIGGSSDPNPTPDQKLDVCFASCQEAPRYGRDKTGRGFSQPENFWDVYTSSDITYIHLESNGGCQCYIGDLDHCETESVSGTVYKIEHQDTKCSCEPYIAFTNSDGDFEDLVGSDTKKTARRYDILYPHDGSNCFQNIDDTIVSIDQSSGTPFSLSTLNSVYVNENDTKTKNDLSFKECYEYCQNYDVFRHVPHYMFFGDGYCIPDSDKRFNVNTADDCFALCAASEGCDSFSHIGAPHNQCILVSNGCNDDGEFGQNSYEWKRYAIVDKCQCYNEGASQIVGQSFMFMSSSTDVLMKVQSKATMNPAPCNIESYLAIGSDTIQDGCNCPIKEYEEAYVEKGYERTVLNGICNGPDSRKVLPERQLLPLYNKGDGTYNHDRCTGECDGALTCLGHLECFERILGYPPQTPGCSGRPVSGDWDYCYDPHMNEDVGASIVTSSPKVRCHGHCTYDKDCGAGLVCYHRSLSPIDYYYFSEWSGQYCTYYFHPLREDGTRDWTDTNHLTDPNHPLYDENKIIECGRRCAAEGTTIYWIVTENVRKTCHCATKDDSCQTRQNPGWFGARIYKWYFEGAVFSDPVPGCYGTSTTQHSYCVPPEWASYDVKLPTKESCAAACDTDASCNTFSLNPNIISGCTLAYDCDSYDYQFEGKCQDSYTDMGITESAELCRNKCTEKRGFLWHPDWKKCACQDSTYNYLSKCTIQSDEKYARWSQNYNPDTLTSIYKKKRLTSTEGRYCKEGEIELYSFPLDHVMADNFACAQNASHSGMEMSRGVEIEDAFICMGYPRYYDEPNDELNICLGNTQCGDLPENNCTEGDFAKTCCVWDEGLCKEKHNYSPCPGGLKETTKSQLILPKGLRRLNRMVLSDERYQSQVYDSALWKVEHDVSMKEECITKCDLYMFRHVAYDPTRRKCICIREPLSSLDRTGDVLNRGLQLYDFTKGLVNNAHDMCHCEGFAIVNGVPKACPSGRYSSKKTRCSSTCELCPVGQFSDEGATECGACVAGQIQVDINTCQDCPAGQYSKAGDISCTLCSPGTYSLDSGSPTCAECQPGMFHNGQVGSTSASDCQNCPAGWSQNERRSTLCKECGFGHYSGTGSSSCLACPTGRYQSQTRQTSPDACTLCWTGEYQDQQGHRWCKPCNPGKYQDQRGAILCKECATGQYQNQVKQTGCKSCPTGQYQDLQKQTGCKHCAKGMYQDQSGQSGCKYCVDGQYADQTGRSACKSCGSLIDSSFKWVNSPPVHVSFEKSCDQYSPCEFGVAYADCGTTSNAYGRLSGYGDEYRRCCNYQQNYFCSNQGSLIFCQTAEGDSQCSSSSGGGFGLTGFRYTFSGRDGLLSCDPPTNGM